jgi:uncharacterized protein YcbX
VSGLAAHEEDDWVGHVIRIGTTQVRIHGHVGRCTVITQSPDSGEVDLPGLDVLSSYRRSASLSEPLAFGVYGAVVSPGEICLGDVVGPVAP